MGAAAPKIKELTKKLKNANRCLSFMKLKRGYRGGIPRYSKIDRDTI